jgi:O-antigen/teichoic acid export membrane protein
MNRQGVFFRRLLSVGMFTLVLRLATLVSKLFLTLAMARLLSPAVLGSYGVVSAVLSIAVVIVGLELYTQGNRELVLLEPEKQVLLIRDQFALYGITYFIAGLIAFACATIGWLTPTASAIVLVLVMADHLSQECFRVLIYLSRTIWANIVLFLRAGAWCYVAVLLMVIAPATRGIEIVLILWAAGALAGIGFAIFAVRDLPWTAIFHTAISWHWIGQRLLTALPFIVTAAAAIASIYSDRFFLDSYAGREAVGVYTLFSGFALAILSLVTATVSQQFLPRLVAAVPRGCAASLSVVKSFLISNIVVTSLISVGAVIAIQPMLAIVGKEEYINETPIFAVLVAAMAARAIADVPTGILYGVRADRRLMVTNLMSMAFSLGLNAALVPTWGVLGAAWAAVGASLAFLCLQTLFAVHSIRRLADIPSPAA